MPGLVAGQWGRNLGDYTSAGKVEPIHTRAGGLHHEPSRPEHPFGYSIRAFNRNTDHAELAGAMPEPE